MCVCVCVCSTRACVSARARVCVCVVIVRACLRACQRVSISECGCLLIFASLTIRERHPPLVSALSPLLVYAT